MNLLVLSPYAENGTKNSGDDLIVKSLVELLESLTTIQINIKVISIAKTTINKEKTFNSIDIRKYDKLLCPGFRITIQGQEKLDIRLKYIESAIMNNIPVFLLGSSWCVFPGIIEQTKFKIDPKEKALIRYIVNDNNSCITTRDNYTQLLLKNNNIDCDMTGDLSLFKIDKINTHFRDEGIKRVAISLPHNDNWYKYCMLIKNKIEENFKMSAIICTHQYIPNNKSYKELYGEYENLGYYNNIDYHVGFRLHGHLWFIRNRKPSLLLAEDGRSFGYINTFNDPGMHVAPQYILNNAKNVNRESMLLKQINRNTRINITKILDLFKKTIENNFIKNKETYKQIDFLWESKMKKIILKILG